MVYSTTLPTRIPGVSVTCQFRITWSFRGPKQRRDAGRSCARSTVVQVAHSFLGQELHDLSAIEVTECRLNEVLSRISDTVHKDTRLVSAQAKIALDARSMETYSSFQSDLRAQYLADLQQRLEIARLDRFKAQVLNNAGNLLSYRLMRNPDQRLTDVKSSEVNDFLEKLSEHDSSLFWVRIAKILESLLKNLTAGQRNDLLQTLSFFARRYGGYEEGAEVERLKREFLD